MTLYGVAIEFRPRSRFTEFRVTFQIDIFVTWMSLISYEQWLMAFFFLNGCTRFVFGILWAFHELDENLLEFIENAIEVRSRPWKRHWNGELSGLLPSFYRVSLWSTESWPVLLGFYRVSRAAKVFHCDYFGDGKKSFTLNEFLLGFELKKKQKTKMRYRVLPSFAGNQKTNVECNVAK